MSKYSGRQSLDRFNGQKEKSPQHVTQKRKFNRDLIQNIASDYYTEIFPHLKNKTGWQSVRCVFHNDGNPSLRINLNHGGFRCHGCNASGDLVKFHMQRQQKTFNETITDLDAWEK